MKAAVLKGINQPLMITEVPDLKPGKDEVIIQVKAAAFNRRDWWIQRGQYAGLKFPIILGSDGSGIVSAIGAGVVDSWLGKEVIINPATNWGPDEAFQQKNFSIIGLPADGTFAEYVKVPADNIHEKPSYLSFEEAAAFPLAGVTAYRALFTKGQCTKGNKVLIVGTGGGAATFALKFAVHAGAEVYVTSGSSKKIEYAKQLGALGGVNYKDPDWPAQLSAMAGQFNVVIDSALGDGFAYLPGLCAPGGRIVFFGGTAGDIPAMNARPIFWRQISILGTTMGSPKDFDEMLRFINEHKVKPVIDTVLPFEQAEAAIRKMDAGNNTMGKIVLKF